MQLLFYDYFKYVQNREGPIEDKEANATRRLTPIKSIFRPRPLQFKGIASGSRWLPSVPSRAVWRHFSSLKSGDFEQRNQATPFLHQNVTFITSLPWKRLALWWWSCIKSENYIRFFLAINYIAIG